MSNAKAIASMANFEADLRRLPTTVAIEAARLAAPKLTELVKVTFSQAETPYGVGWLPGADGQKITLRKSGALEKNVAYTATGTRIRLRLGVSYAKYQVGRRRVAPRRGGALPAAYSAALADAAVEACKRGLGR